MELDWPGGHCCSNTHHCSFNPTTVCRYARILVLPGSDPSNSTDSMPATVTVVTRSNGVSAGAGDDGGSSTGDTPTSDDSDGGDADGHGDGDEGGDRSAVVLTLGSPEVDRGTGNTVFSLSAAREVKINLSPRGVHEADDDWVPKQTPQLR